MLDDNHIRWLANALAKNQVKNILPRLENKKKLILVFKTLKSLNLYGNIITEQGAEYLSNALKSNKVRTCWGKNKGEKAEVRVLTLPLYSHRTPTVLPWYSHDTPKYFHGTPRYSRRTPVVLPSYSHGTPMILPNTSMVLPGTPRYFHCTSGSTEVDEVSLFPPCLIHFEIFRL